MHVPLTVIVDIVVVDGSGSDLLFFNACCFLMVLLMKEKEKEKEEGKEEEEEEEVVVAVFLIEWVVALMNSRIDLLPVFLNLPRNSRTKKTNDKKRETSLSLHISSLSPENRQARDETLLCSSALDSLKHRKVE